MVVPWETYKPFPEKYECGNPIGTKRCGLPEQLVELDTLDAAGRGMGDEQTVPVPWNYARVEERVNNWISANSGDIVLLANGRYRFQFGAPYRGQHGSLTEADALVPVAFGYLGTTGSADTVLETLKSFFLNKPEPIAEPGVEEKALRAFFGLPLP